MSLENTLLTLLRLQSLAFGFETIAWGQKTTLSRLLTVFKEQPDTDKCIFWVNGYAFSEFSENSFEYYKLQAARNACAGRPAGDRGA